MKRRTIWFAALLSICLGGCSSTYNHLPTGGLERAKVSLDPAKAILIAIPADGTFGEKRYGGSGQAVAQRTAAEFGKFANRVEISAGDERDKLLQTARNKGSGYLVIPTISHWEHRATAWSGIPSRVGIAMTILDADSGEEITSSILESNSAAFTLLATSPENQLPILIGGYVDQLFGQAPARRK